jgi:hypothetical protein
VSTLPLVLPRGWELVEAAAPVELIAAAPEGEFTGFRPNLVLTVPAGPELAEQGASLLSFRMIDRMTTELTGGACVRSLGHHEVGGSAVVVEQWLWAEGSCELAASCGALDYPRLADAFAAAAASLRPPAAA